MSEGTQGKTDEAIRGLSTNPEFMRMCVPSSDCNQVPGVSLQQEISSDCNQVPGVSLQQEISSGCNQVSHVSLQQEISSGCNQVSHVSLQQEVSSGCNQVSHVSLQQEGDPRCNGVPKSVDCGVGALGSELSGSCGARLASVGFVKGDAGVGYSRNLLEDKKVEVSTRVTRKVTVSEEFPSNCPQSVALKCLSIELRRLQKLLYEEDKAQLMRDRLGETVIPDESIESWAWFRVPWQACGLQPCPDTVIDASEQVELCGVGWPMKADVSGALNEVAAQHLKVCSLLQTVEEDNSEQVCSSVDKIYWNALDALERQGCELQGYESQLLNSANSVVLRSLSAIDSETPVDEGELVKAEGLAQDGEGLSDPPPLQTKIIGADQVRREPEKWIPSMTEEYQSLVSRTGAVQELSDSAYKQLMEDPTVVLEVIPGKLVYVHKSSGRRKSRIVGCGNFCQGGSNERNELYASGAGAEALRLMVRKCTLCPGWVLASVDVRTAFLQAPLLEQQREGKRLITIVRVPSILRETGVTTCKFWRVQKALYGLASAPRSWSNYRDKVLSELRIPCGSDVLQLVKMVEDANLLHIIRVSSEGDDSSAKGWKAGVVALYVDDILIGAERPVCEAVIKALQDQWELSSPEWIANPGDQMKFAGYELQKTREGIRLHQESYTQDLIEQNEEVVTGTERTPAVKMVGFDEVTDEDERRDLVKRSQCLIGQLLWLAGRTRPDLAYGVSMAAQKIASCPREALARAEHLVKYLRGSVGASLHYKAADGKCGRWDQLRHRQTDCTLDVYTDASFAADEQCRSFGSVHLYWGGALVSWAAARQTLIAAHTAESELYSLSEGHLMGKAFRPTVAALMDIDEKSVQCHLYCDNMAAVQLCTLEAGSWRTRHLRLRGAIIRQDLENEDWVLAHLDGVFMPADLGTKPVGPARLEDLLKLCDMWTPHLEASEEPPRPSVATVQSGLSGFMSTLLALLMLVQVNGAKAWEYDRTYTGWETVGFGFGLGFGLGCGFWLAIRFGQGVDVCLRSLRRAVRNRRARVQARRGRQQLELQRPEESGIPVISARTVEEPAVVQPDRQGASGVMIPLNDGSLVPLEEATYEDVREAYYADLRDAFVQAGQVEDMPEVLREGTEFQRLREVLGSPRAPTVARPPGYPDGYGGGLVLDLERPVYHIGDQPGVADEDQSSTDESEQSMSVVGSTASGGARHLLETGSAASASLSSSGASHQSAASRVVGLSTLMFSQAQGASMRSDTVQDSGWELWVVLGLIVIVSMGVGAFGAWLVWKCSGSSRSFASGGQPSAELVGEQVGCDVGSTPASGTVQQPQVSSPVINITVTGSVFEEGKQDLTRSGTVRVAEELMAQEADAGCAESQSSSSRGLSSSSVLRRRVGPDSIADSVGPEGLGPIRLRVTSEAVPAMVRQGVRRVDEVETRTLGPKGLGSSRTCVVPESIMQKDSSAEAETRTLGPKGLGPSRPCVVRESTVQKSSSAETETRTLGPKGLGPIRPRAVQESTVHQGDSTEARTRTLDPRGLGPCKTQGEDLDALGLGTSTTLGLTSELASVARKPLDRFRRPWGMKKKEFLSSGGEDPRPFVYLTQNGLCLHSGTTCQPMQCSGAAIQRSLCRFCFGSEGLPPRRGTDGADRVVYLTRSGHYVHTSDRCECLDVNEELLSRKFCRCCRWG